MIYTEFTVITGLITIILAYLGTDIGFRWYRRKHYDKLVHFLSGVVIGSFLYSNGVSTQNNFIFNGVIAYLWEHFQLFSSRFIAMREYGFPDGYFDLIAHLAGVYVYLFILL